VLALLQSRGPPSPASASHPTSSSYRNVEELLTEPGVDHVTIYRRAQRFTPLLADAARPCRHLVGDRRHADETYVKVAGQWRYVYRAIDQFGQVMTCSSRHGGTPRLRTGSSNGRSVRPGGARGGHHRSGAGVPGVLEELLVAAWHRTDQYSNNRVEGDQAG
jgi:hypothetical protein